MAVSVEEYKKSLDTLEQALDRLDTRKDVVDYKINRDACIQRFEFCIELAWKTSIKFLGSTASAPKPALREMARAGLIDNFEAWLTFLEARNKGSHSYHEDVAREVLAVLKVFLPEGKKLAQKLSAK